METDGGPSAASDAPARAVVDRRNLHRGYAVSGFSGFISQPIFFDPSGGSGAMRLAQTTMQEMTGAEETLLALYDKHSPAIRAGADDE